MINLKTQIKYSTEEIVLFPWLFHFHDVCM